jgi:NAD(P)H-hydrate epimerase
MSVLAALQSGAGLVTAFVPESLAASFAARAPEAMWVGWPETPDGGLAMEGVHLLDARLNRATAVLIGPGLGREAETLAWVQDFLKRQPHPFVLDADALQPGLVQAGRAPRILTPHAGEFVRIGGERPLADFARSLPGTVVLKGASTRISDGECVYYSIKGGPVLARGGSGDLLAGLIGGLLAQNPAEPLRAACGGTVWHGMAADRLARAQGQVAVRVTALLGHLAPVLRER